MSRPALKTLRVCATHQPDGRALFWRELSTGEVDLIHRRLDRLSEAEQALLAAAVPTTGPVALADNRGWQGLVSPQSKPQRA